MELIAGDIGGTKSWLVWETTRASGARQLRFEKSYPSAQFNSAAQLVRQFIDEARTGLAPDALTLALPGAVHQQPIRLTNLDWTLDAAELRVALKLPVVHFINDFQAAAAGVASLQAQEVVALNSATPEPGGVRVITGAGTGLGLAFMLTDATGIPRLCATEGGHIDFAPANAQQQRLLTTLQAQYGHVSWERVASGSALNDLYHFCRAERGLTQTAETLDGASLSARAADGDTVADATLALFVTLYGAWVGNVALLYQPFGGLYLAGGVTTHLMDRLSAPGFMAAARDKGRMRHVVERTPVFAVTSPRLGVQGALAWAREQALGSQMNSNKAA